MASFSFLVLLLVALIAIPQGLAYYGYPPGFPPSYGPPIYPPSYGPPIYPPYGPPREKFQAIHTPSVEKTVGENIPVYKSQLEKPPTYKPSVEKPV
ncbi:hypothetical protein RYX36_012358 [Vicia faba]